jgi:hypothetical protein
MSSGNWNTFNSYNPFVPCGITNSLGNATGVVSYTIDNESGVSYTFNVPSYRGIENPFGHVWSWTDGCLCVIQSADGGGRSIFFTCDDPALFSSTSVAAYTERGDLPRGEGYVKTLMLGEYGENMPTAVGGGSSTYYCDYFYTNIPSSGEAIRGVLFGGAASYGAYAGLACATTSDVPTYAYTRFGSRLCFIPEAA